MVSQIFGVCADIMYLSYISDPIWRLHFNDVKTDELCDYENRMELEKLHAPLIALSAPSN